MNYWLNLFTGTTWQEFQAAGAQVSGFRQRNWKRAEHIKVGDVFLCYMVGVKRWVGLLAIMSQRFHDESKVFGEEVFPVRFKVKPLVMLKPEHGVPMEELESRLTFYPAGATSKQWSGHVRSSPTKYKPDDGAAIAEAIKQALANPVVREVDAKQLARSANLYKLKTKAGNEEIEAVISVPSVEDEDEAKAEPESPEAPTHTEIQYRLLDLGSQMGLNVWAPKSDRGRNWKGSTVGKVPRMLDSLPTQFDKVTNKTIENIDVLWLSNQSIAAAFEVEHTTSIYSGLLRMSDLITMQPNIDINFYLVAPDERLEKFQNEVARATFASRKKPLHSMCRFMPYSKLCERLDRAKDVIRFLRPEFLDDIAVHYDPADEVDAS
jgi:hypothetical protein